MKIVAAEAGAVMGIARFCTILVLVFTTMFASMGLESGSAAQGPPKSPRPARGPKADPLPAGAVARLGSLYFRHGDSVRAMAQSADGKFLATVSPGRPAGLQIWVAADGKQRFQFNKKGYQDVAFMPDNRTAVLGTWEAGVAFVDLATGKELRQFATQNASERIALSPDGKVLATWTVDRGEPVPPVNKGGKVQLNQIPYQPSGGKNIVCLYDAATGKLLHRLERPHDIAVTGDVRKGGMNGGGLDGEFWNIKFLAFAAGGKYIASGSWDKSVHLWDVQTGKLVRHFGGAQQPAYCFAMSADGKVVAAAGSDRKVRGYDVDTGKTVFEFDYGMQRVQSMAFAPDGKRLAIAGGVLEGGRLIPGDALWDVATGQMVRQFPSWGACLTYSPDGKVLYVCEGNGTTRPFDVVTGKELRSKDGHDGLVLGLAFAPDGQTVVSEGDDRTIRFWSLKTGKEVGQWEGYCVSLCSGLAFSPDGRQLAARLDDNTVRIRDVASGKDVHTLKGHKGFIFPIAFSADGKTLISAERDGPTLTWNAASGKQTGEIKHSFPHGNNINLSADGSLLAVSKDTYGFPAQQEIGIWETATGKLRTTIRNDSKEPAGLFVFSPDRKHIVGGMSAGLICVWEVNTGKETLRFTAHDFWANCLAISPDGKIVASTGGFEKTIRLWDFKTGKQLAQFPAHGYQVYSLAFSPDGSLLASGGADSTIMLWEVPKK